MNKYLASSANPDELSATIGGILIGLIPATIFIGQLYGVELSQTELLLLAQIITTGLASIVMAFGIVRKIYIRITNR